MPKHDEERPVEARRREDARRIAPSVQAPYAQSSHAHELDPEHAKCANNAALGTARKGQAWNPAKDTT